MARLSTRAVAVLLLLALLLAVQLVLGPLLLARRESRQPYAARTPEHRAQPPEPLARRPGRPVTGGAAAAELANCARTRKGHVLVYAAHSGFGNQELALRRALLVAYVLNRTLVLPPLLAHNDLAFGPPEVRCRERGWQSALQARAEQLYAEKAAGSAGGRYEPMRAAFDFGELTRLGVRTVDYASLPAATRGALSSAPLLPLGCSRGDRYTAQALRAAAGPSRAAGVARLGSAYFLKADLVGLRATDRCFDAVAAAALRLPLSRAVQRTADAAIARMRGAPFASVHLRMLGGGGGGVDSLGAADADAVLASEVRWLGARLRKRLRPGCCDLFVASNVPGGVASPRLAPLCEGRARVANCTDIRSLGVSGLPEWSELLGDRGGEAGAGAGARASGSASAGDESAAPLAEATATLLTEQAIGAAAGRGFFSTSKFCGPAGFRRSTFSEGIALRWGQRRGAAPLCANAAEHALLRGMAAHGEHVY